MKIYARIYVLSQSVRWAVYAQVHERVWTLLGSRNSTVVSVRISGEPFCRLSVKLSLVDSTLSSIFLVAVSSLLSYAHFWEFTFCRCDLCTSFQNKETYKKDMRSAMLPTYFLTELGWTLLVLVTWFLSNSNTDVTCVCIRNLKFQIS